MYRKTSIRVLTRRANGSFADRRYSDLGPLFRTYSQVGRDDYSIDLDLRGLPLFRGLVGPMPDETGAARYETPEIFEKMTVEWIHAPDVAGQRQSFGPKR